MPAPNAISFDKLSRIIGTPRSPQLIDLRSDEDFTADPRLLPGAMRGDDRALTELAAQLAGQPAIALCQAGHRRSQGAAAWLRAEGCPAEYLDGGFEAWRAAGLLAASLGLSRMYSEDLEQLEAGMLLYDAFFRWARDATDETHDWPTNRPKAE